MSKADNNWFIQNSIWIAKRDEQARKTAAREKGLAEGRAQGLAEGRAEGALKNSIDTATKMLIKKYPVEEIHELTGLPKEKILELQTEIQRNE